MRTILIVTLACVLLSAFQCRKESNGRQIEIKGFRIADALGNPMGEVGSSSDDWILYDSFNDQIMNLFNFSTPLTISTSNTATIQTPVAAFPNPVAFLQYYVFNVSDSVLLKAMVVDERLTVYQQFSYKFKGHFAFSIDYSDRTIYPDKTALRVYYSFSAAGKPNYKVGYGDIKICDASGGGLYTTCF